MPSRRNFVLAGVVTVFASTLTIPLALASEHYDYTQAAFEKAQKDGRSILIEVHATWCSTCKVQVPILLDLKKDARFRNLVVFRVDFDTQKDVMKRLSVRMQSTLIAFKGPVERGRSIGDTNRDSIAELLTKAI